MRAIKFMSEKPVIAVLLSLAISTAAGHLNAQADNEIPDLAGVWNGGFSARPINGETVPWGEENFPKLNARALAYQEVWEEIIAPKYDCQPASSPAIQYDPTTWKLCNGLIASCSAMRRMINCAQFGWTVAHRSQRTSVFKAFR